MEKKESSERKTYFLMAIIGYKYVFKKLIQLIKYKIKGIYLQIQYKAALISCEKELNKIDKEKPNLKETISKYLYILIIGIGIFLLLQMQLEKSRGYKAIGGEGVFLVLPFIWALGASLQEEDKNNDKE